MDRKNNVRIDSCYRSDTLELYITSYTKVLEIEVDLFLR